MYKFEVQQQLLTYIQNDRYMYTVTVAISWFVTLQAPTGKCSYMFGSIVFCRDRPTGYCCCTCRQKPSVSGKAGRTCTQALKAHY